MHGKVRMVLKNRVLPKALSLEDSLMLNELPNNLNAGADTNNLVLEYGSVFMRNR
jgi:hypothetical protein